MTKARVALRGHAWTVGGYVSPWRRTAHGLSRAERLGRHHLARTKSLRRHNLSRAKRLLHSLSRSKPLRRHDLTRPETSGRRRSGRKALTRWAWR